MNIQESFKKLPQIVSQCGEYSELWLKRPDDFFQTFWLDLKLILACQELTLLFSNINIAEGPEDKKPVLTRSKLTGEESPQMHEATEAEDRLFLELSQASEETLWVHSWDEKRQAVTLVARLGKRPFIIMARGIDYNAFQDAILRTYLNGIEYFLKNRQASKGS